MNYTEQKIVLASKSPRRKQLLEWAGQPFDIITKDTAEDFPDGLSPREAAIHIARNKALAVLPESGDRLVLAADTIVVLNNSIIGKPADIAEAIETLSKLSGATHTVITGVCLSDGMNEVLFAEETRVSFHPLSEEQIRFYVEHYKPFDKAGAYAIQEWIGVTGIKRIEGDFYNVMGLPVSRVLQEISTWHR